MHSQNPIESFTAPYEIFKVYRFGLRHCPTAFPDQSAPGRKSLKKIFATVISPALSSAFGFVILPVAKGLVGISRMLYQLSYIPISTVCRHNIHGMIWWNQGGSNSRPPACKAGALPTELWPHMFFCHRYVFYFFVLLYSYYTTLGCVCQ